jgi:hypothetical protein
MRDCASIAVMLVATKDHAVASLGGPDALPSHLEDIIAALEVADPTGATLEMVTGLASKRQQQTAAPLQTELPRVILRSSSSAERLSVVLSPIIKHASSSESSEEGSPSIIATPTTRDLGMSIEKHSAPQVDIGTALISVDESGVAMNCETTRRTSKDLSAGITVVHMLEEKMCRRGSFLSLMSVHGSDVACHEAAKRIQQLYRGYRARLSLELARTRGRGRLSTKRIAYLLGDLFYPISVAIAGEEGAKLVESLFSRSAEDGLSNGSTLSRSQLASFMRDVLGGALKEQELRALANCMESSNEEITVKDVHQFLSTCGTSEICFSIKHTAATTSVAFSLDKKYLVSGSLDGLLRIILNSTGEQVFGWQMPRPIGDVAMSSHGDRVAAGCQGGCIQWICVSDRKILHEWDLGDDCLSLSVDLYNTELAASGRNGLLNIYSLESMAILYTFTSSSPLCAVSLASKLTFSFTILGEGQKVTRLANVMLFRTDTGGLLELPTVTMENQVNGAHGAADSKIWKSATTVVVEGFVLAANDGLGIVNVWTALLDALDSLHMLVFMLTLVMVGTVLAILKDTTLNSGAEEFQKKIENLFLGIFILELVLRIAVHCKVHGHLHVFFSNVFCVIDLFVVILDLSIMAAEEFLSGMKNIPVSALRLVRMARVVRLLRAGRVISQVTNRVKRVPQLFDVALSNGSVLKRVHRSRLRSLDLAFQMSLHDRADTNNNDKDDENHMFGRLQRQRTYRQPVGLQQLTGDSSAIQWATRGTVSRAATTVEEEPESGDAAAGIGAMGNAAAHGSSAMGNSTAGGIGVVGGAIRKGLGHSHSVLFERLSSPDPANSGTRELKQVTVRSHLCALHSKCSQ